MSRKERILDVTVAITAAAYAAGQSIGGKLTLLAESGLWRGVLGKIVLTDLAVQNAAMELWLFNHALASTITDRAAIDLDDADLPYLVDIIEITADLYKALADNAAAIADAGGTVFECPAGDLQGFLVCRGTPTYVTTADVHLRAHVLESPFNRSSTL